MNNCNTNIDYYLNLLSFLTFLVNNYNSNSNSNTKSINSSNNTNTNSNNACYKTLIDYYLKILLLLRSITNEKKECIDTYKKNKELEKLVQKLTDMDYLKKLYESKAFQSKALINISVTAGALKISEEYAIYHEKYGIPPNFTYDLILLKEIKDSL
jgi:hypothetical protein